MSTVDIMTRTPDLLPGTLDLLILRTLVSVRCDRPQRGSPPASEG
jgi:hypothetical protein